MKIKIADSRQGESECKLLRKVTCGGECVVSGIMLRLRVRRKWSEVCSGETSTRSVLCVNNVQLVA